MHTQPTPSAVEHHRATRRAVATAHRKSQLKRQRAERAAAEHLSDVERMAQDIENICARQGSMNAEDLFTLGWSTIKVAELQNEALELVRTRAHRPLDPVN